MVGYAKNAPKDEEWLRGELADIIMWVGAECHTKCKVEYQNCRECDVCNNALDKIIVKMKEGGWVSPAEHKEALSRELAAGYRLAVDFTKGGE